MEDTKNYKARIIAYRGDRSACFNMRLDFPLYHFVKNNPDYYINITGVLSKDQLTNHDLYICQRQIKPEVYYPLMEAKKKRGIKIVYEADDDFFNVPEWNPAYNVYGKKVVQENIKTFLLDADACFVSTQYLADIYSEYCRKVYVLPNSLDFSVFKPAPKNSAKKVVLWTGSFTHDRDVQLMRPALEKLSKDSDVLVKMFYFNTGISGIHNIPFVDIRDFYAMLAESDAYIGLAPLTTAPFNKSKSNLKFLEYTMQGIPTIASNVGPYAESIQDGVTGILISDNRDWYDNIRYLIANEDIHDTMAENAKKFVVENFDISKNYVRWKNAVDEILGIK